MRAASSPRRNVASSSRKTIGATFGRTVLPEVVMKTVCGKVRRDSRRRVLELEAVADDEAEAAARVVAERLLELGRRLGLGLAHLGAELVANGEQPLVGRGVPAGVADRPGVQQRHLEAASVDRRGCNRRSDGERRDEERDDRARRHWPRTVPGSVRRATGACTLRRRHGRCVGRDACGREMWPIDVASLAWAVQSFAAWMARPTSMTGASDGIGRALALRLAAGGANVVVAARSAAGLEETLRLGGDARGRMLAVPADVADPNACARVIAGAVERFGGSTCS